MITWKNLQIRIDYESNPKLCEQCKVAIDFKHRENIYCSHSCAAKITNLGNTKNKIGLNGKPLENFVEHSNLCKGCGLEKDTKRRYCESCTSKGLNNRKIQSSEQAKDDSSRRKYLRRTRGNVCEECGLSEWHGVKLTVQMHHIDGNPDNNTESNLKLLCPNCHSITPNYGRKNKINQDTQRNRKRRNHYHTGEFKENVIYGGSSED